MDDDVGAGPRQPDAMGAALPTRGAGDEGDSTGQGSVVGAHAIWAFRVGVAVGLRDQRWGSGRERTSVGHQNHGPRMRRMHGTTNERTIRVSSSRPMHTVEPT